MIQSIIKKAIKRLESEGKLLTPEYYAEAFCKEASKAGRTTQDCNHLEKFQATLNEDLKKELSTYRVTSIAELTRFLISKLNRTSSSHCSNLLESLNKLTKRLLQAVDVLHNKEASQLAVKSIELLNSEATPKQIDSIRKDWANFITTYDDTFLKILGEVDTKNLKESIDNLSKKTTSSSSEKEFSSIASILIASLVPSIATSANEQLSNLSKKINDNPSLLDNTSIESEIKSAITLRIALDKESLKDMVESLDGVLDKLSLRIIEIMEGSDNSTVEIQQIKSDLESYNDESSVNFKQAHKKLYTIAVALEENTQCLSKDLKEHTSDINTLSAKIRKLEKELEVAKEESKEDFLTKLYNKRALDEVMNIKDYEYERYARNYSIAMFDLDLFKNVNDNYGHDAGDAVLAAFARILKKEARAVDTVGRFGGEEFMVILSDTDTKNGAIYAEKVRTKVQNARFMYKGERIELTVSVGVSQRKTNTSLENVIKLADEHLYKAKKNGRNRVSYE